MRYVNSMACIHTYIAVSLRWRALFRKTEVIWPTEKCDHVRHDARIQFDPFTDQFINFQIPIRSTIKPINEINVRQYCRAFRLKWWWRWVCVCAVCSHFHTCLYMLAIVCFDAEKSVSNHFNRFQKEIRRQKKTIYYFWAITQWRPRSHPFVSFWLCDWYYSHTFTHTSIAKSFGQCIQIR